MEINVELVKSIELPVEKQVLLLIQIHHKATIKIMPNIRLINHMLTTSICPFSFEWSASHDILNI